MINHNYGCLFPKVDLRDYKLCSDNLPDTCYPSKFELSDLPRVKDQGEVNSCCAYAASSILEYHAKNKYRLSTNFIYGIQRSMFNQCEKGMYLSQACQIVRKYGDMTEESCKGNDEIPICYSQAEACLNDDTSVSTAYKFRINSYYLCQTKKDIKFALMNYGPVLGAIMWREEYTLGKDNVVYFDRKSSGNGHAVFIYGWNDKGWLVQNSWGQEFANNGRFILPYDYGFVETRAIIDENNQNEFDEIVLIKPDNNEFKNVFYKIANFFINIVKHIKEK